jgi:hypothetical protein
MDTGIIDIFSSTWTAFLASSFFFYLKVFAGFVTAVLLIADILLLSKRIRGDVKIAVYGAKVPSLKKSVYVKRWESIKNRIEEGSISSAKMAVIEADKMLSEVLEKVGYKGKDTAEKIAAVKPGQLIGIEDVVESHNTFKRIIQNHTLEISHEELHQVLAGYEKVFQGLELLD